jgi:hypothetical protein
VSGAAELVIELDRGDWLPGETLRGRLRLSPALAAASGTVHVEVGWRTESDAQPDHGSVPAEEQPGASPEEWSFTATLPAAPLSYEGLQMSIRWHVTAQVTPAGGPAQTAEAPFRLGRVAPITAPAAPP